FKNYISSYNNFDHFVKDGLETAFNEQIHFKSQLFWIADNKSKIKVDHIIKFEDINTELPKLLLKCKIQPKDLMVYNKMGTNNYKDFYTDKSIKKVAEIYSKEINKFGFKF